MSPRFKILLVRALILRPIDHWPYKQAKGIHHPLHGESFVHYIPWSLWLLGLAVFLCARAL